MESGTIPDDVQTFLRDFIESYEQLEVLLLLHRRQHMAQSADAVAAALGMPSAAIVEAFTALIAAGLIEEKWVGCERQFRYRTTDSRRADLVRRLVEICDSSRLEVMKLMTANAVERLRTSAQRAFANALPRGRRDDEDG